jgi:hypothetical protein
MREFPIMKEMYAYDNVYDPDFEIGIEIEMEGRGLDIPRNRFWNCKVDGSLRGESREFISNGPMRREIVGLKLNMLQDRLHRAVLAPSDRCGVHIHINCQYLTFHEVFNFMFLYLVLEEVLVSYCGESREGNMFCLRASDAEYFVDRMIECKRTSDLRSLIKDGGDQIRYASINPGALFKFGSLEFRALRTPTDLTEIEEWMWILTKVKDAALSLDDPMQVIEDYSGMGEDRFLEHIMGADLSLLLQKRVKNIPTKVLNGIRLVQDIAYTPTVKHPITLRHFFPKRKPGDRMRRRQAIADRDDLDEALDRDADDDRGDEM